MVRDEFGGYCCKKWNEDVFEAIQEQVVHEMRKREAKGTYNTRWRRAQDEYLATTNKKEMGVFRDIIISPDLKPWTKALWILVVILLAPMIGVLIYLIVRGKNMHERYRGIGREHDEGASGYVASTATDGSSTADQLSSLAALHERGHLTDDEYEAEKAKLLAASS